MIKELEEIQAENAKLIRGARALLKDIEAGKVAVVPTEPDDTMLIAGRFVNVGPRGTVHTYIIKAAIKAAPNVMKGYFDD